MNIPTLEEIKQATLRKKMVVFTRPFDVNLGGLRTKDNTSGLFNDWVFAYYHDENGNVVGRVVAGTTDAGIYYRNKPLNKDGTAIIVHDRQHRGVYQLQDPAKNKNHVGHKGRKAFRQIKDMAYWRDNDRDSVLDFGGKIYIQNGATNGHYMGTVGKKVEQWSAGCWGATEMNMNIIYGVAQKQIDNGLGDVFSYTLLYEPTFHL